MRLIPVGGAACAAAIAAIFMVTPAAAGQVRDYYIAAEEVRWDYAPEGRDLMMGTDYTEDQKVFVEAGPGRIGSTYTKIRYIGYTDETFATKSEVTDPSLAFLGRSSVQKWATRSACISATKAGCPPRCILTASFMTSCRKAR